jgi:hypothetical protein
VQDGRSQRYIFPVTDSGLLSERRGWPDPGKEALRANSYRLIMEDVGLY